MTDDSQTHTSTKTKTESRKPLWVYLKQCTAHLWLGIRALWPLWAVIVAFVAVVWIVIFWGCREEGIRWLGMFLQLGGFVMVAMKLIKAARSSQNLSVPARTALYFKRFPRRRVTSHNLSAQGFSVGRPTIGSARVITLPGPDTPLEKRVEMLEERTTNLVSEVGELGGKLRAQSDELTIKITEEATQRKSGHRAFEEQLERAVIGSIHVEWWGVIFFSAGIIISSTSPELAGVCWGML